MSDVEKRIRAQANDTFRRNNPDFFSGSFLKGERLSNPIPVNEPHKNLLKAVKTSKQAILVNSFRRIWYDLCEIKLEEEFRFHPERKFRCDFCHLPTRTCIEIEGGIFNRKGGHSSITGILRDIEKYNELNFLGFRLFRFHGKQGVAGSIDVPNLTRLIQFLNRSKP